MAAIFVVTDGEYSDYHVVGVFSSRYKAKEFLVHNPGMNIEEYILDDGFDFYKNGWKVYIIEFDKDGCIVGRKAGNEYRSITCGPFTHRYWRDPDMIYVNNIIAPDEATAIKIASEKRFQFLVEEEKRGKTR